MAEVKTLVIDNFQGSMTQYVDGNINSGLSSVLETFGNDPFSKPGNLTWMEQAEQIDPNGDVITDLVVAGKGRMESGIAYVYAVGHTGRLYKIQVNDPTTFEPDLDNPVLLATLTAQTPTFTRGGSIDFFGSTEQIYIGHDKGVTRIDFDGTDETFVGTLGSWVQNVPRVLKQFLGKLYTSNGNNLAEIDSTASVTDYSKLDPAFPTGTQIRDIDVSPDGNYLSIIVSRLALPDITVTSQDTTTISNSGSFNFKWNGLDIGYTSYDSFPSFSLVSSTLFGNNQYTFGYDLFGTAVFNPTEKIITGSDEFAPLPSAVGSNGNFVIYSDPLFYEDHLEVSITFFGSQDREIGTGYWAPFGQLATDPETDVIQVPFQLLVSNIGIGASSNGYTNNIFGTSKLYFSTLETSASPTTAYRFYKWSPVPRGLGTAIEGVYQTQTQLFSKKVKIVEVRIYGEPWVTNNSFTIDLIGSAGNPITNGSKTFTAGSNLTVGDDFALYNPEIEPTYALGLRVTNVGTVNHTISKIEIDYTLGGK